MDRIAQLQFQCMAPVAQAAAIRRLALSGLTAHQIADAVGWPPERVRHTLNAPIPSHSDVPRDWLARRASARGAGRRAEV
jgi:hypothetical protein